MNIFAISGILIGITSSVMVVLMFWTFFKTKRAQHLLWGLFCVSTAIWGWGAYQIATTTDIVSADFWWRITHIGIIFIPVLFTHFVFTFLEIKRPKFIAAIYGLSFFFLGVNLIGDTFIANMRWVFDQFYFDSPPGIFYIPFTVMFFGLVTYSLIELWLAHKKARGLTKTQIKYFFISAIVSFGGGSLSFLPVYKIDLYPVLNLLVCLFPVIIGYAITRYRLMDIRLVINRTIIYLSTFASVVGVGYGLLFFNNSLKEPFPFSVFFPAILIIVSLSFRFIFGLFERIANRYFYYTFYSYQKVLNDLGKQLTQILDIKRLSALIVDTLQKTMKLDKIIILIRRESGSYAVLKNVGFKSDGVISLVKDKFLIGFLQRSRNPLVFDELFLLKNDATQVENRKAIKVLQKNMQKIEANVCLPLFRAKKIMGLIILGGKISGDAYSKEDLGLLDVLASQASIAIENAQLYGQVNDLSFNLQKKVDEQTKELVVAYNELKRTNRLKTEFLGMSSHQLRTPLTIIKGYLSMTLEGDYGKVPPKIRTVLDNVFLASQRLVKIVGDLLDVSRIDLGKMKLEKTTVQIEDIIKSCHEDMKMKAEEKGLKMIYKKPSSRLPKIEVDESKIRQVILNLIDNSIRYTIEGHIVISVEKKNRNILIKIKDTGVGLSKDEQKDIFEGFTRGTAGINHFTEGAGLGLYVSKKYLDLHKGKVWSKSPGKGKGSTFYVEIPIT